MGSKSGQQQQTSAEVAQAQHATDLMADYKQRWLPVQKQLASQIEQEGAVNSSARKLATGKSSTDTAMAFDKAEGQSEKSLANAGVGIGSGRADLATTTMQTDAAASTGMGHMMSEQSIDDAYTQGLGALTALGQGEKATVGKSMTMEATQSAGQAAADANASLINAQGNAKLGGQIAGFGMQQAGSYFAGMPAGGSGSGANFDGGIGEGRTPLLGGINT